ncbi:type I restriction endonuclease subunit R [Laribacter hongkongensis]|uniref:type I restriction endonuclease subunit R n=1 Tax=Laribacter hongkongensis TaxID=168471 RepID=UPI001EFDB7E5|nr:type I restriction endonuclease [Laribacter hongkongensis]MCG9042129.1 DEAD/DEAH box helicase family protein [Laribacter hongkongensis]MCG9066934.1 DEAD/DEAH box helicase family protein [Laribacter hongkongensis]
MVSQTNEAALETHIENALAKDGYCIGNLADFDREFAIDGKLFWQFIEATQPKELAKLKDRPNWQRLLLERLNKKIKKDSVLAVLKKGLDIDDAHFDLLYRLPYNDLNPEVVANFAANVFSVTRQVHYSESDTFKSVDMVLFVNGLAIASLELKNPWTGQNVHNAIKQYRTDRDPREPLFEFGRCLVHFAVDPDEAFMCAQLAGNDSNFLPFNKGFNFGKGNPVNPKGHKTAYLWDDILPRRSLTNIIEQFAKFTVEKDKKTGKERKALFFPRYHQLDVVRGILADAKQNGIGQTYLIQHSAGSGKSNSITWLAYQLVELYDTAGTANVFDSVVVVTDRRVLDTQLKDNIKLFSETKNIVAHAESAAELKAHLELGKKIIITTVQKFPFIVDGIDDLTDRNFAVIIDEAHSSQSGSASDKLNMTLGAEDEEAPEDLQDKILGAMKGRKMSQNASYFAFTATPKPATLEKFGRQGPDGKFYPFHLYSMKQAIEEKFILDVLEKYTTYKSYYEVQKSVEENPLFNTAKAQKKLKAFVEASPRTIEVKAKIMVDHFMSNVWQAKKLKGKAKAMVVTRNIECAIRYFFAIRTALQEANAPFKALVAFSGEKTVDGIKYTEDGINGIPARDLPEEFEKDGFKILVVANKYLTGFDEPMLHTMYVDKKLQGVLAVQALSRLNRCNWKLGKTDTFVLDFYNTVDDIKAAFDPFYTATTLSEPTDVNVLHDLKDVLDNFGIYDWPEVTTFNEKFFASAEAEELHPIIDTVVARFDADLDDEQRIDFKIKAKQFVKIYAQVAAIIPFNNVNWEMLHWFLKFLIPKLKVKDPDQDKLDELLNSIDLSTYGLERSRLETKIGLDASETELEPQNPNVRGGHFGDGDKDPLDEIVRAFNERHFAGWEATPEEQRVKFINIAKHVMNHADYKAQVEDNPDSQNRQLALERLIQQAISVERRRELDLYKRYASDPDFKRAFDASVSRLLASAASETLLTGV